MMHQLNSQKIIWVSEYQNVPSMTLSQMTRLCQRAGFQTYLCARYFLLVTSRQPAALSHGFVRTTFYRYVDNRK